MRKTAANTSEGDGHKSEKLHGKLVMANIASADELTNGTQVVDSETEILHEELAMANVASTNDQTNSTKSLDLNENIQGDGEIVENKGDGENAENKSDEDSVEYEDVSDDEIIEYEYGSEDELDDNILLQNYGDNFSDVSED